MGDVDFQQCRCLRQPASRARRRRAISSEAARAGSDSSTESTARRSAPASPPGVWIRLYSGGGSVRVSHGMLEKKVVVAPNAPRRRDSTSIGEGKTELECVEHGGCRRQK